MEYNLQKTLNDNSDFDSYNGDDFSTDLFDSVTPGIGQIVPDDDFIVPLYNNSDFTTIMKEDNLDTLEQIGGGQDEDLEQQENDQSSEAITQTNLTDSSELERKRKQMDPEIYESFMHPKLFKTNTLSFDSHKKEKKKDLKTEKEKEKIKQIGGKASKHKFNVY